MLVSIDQTGLPGVAELSFDYDLIDQLTTVNDQVDYGYDPADNLVATPLASTQAFDVAHQLCWVNLEASTGTVEQPLGYTGQYFDAETGLYQLRARYYEPTTGQFLTVDPMVGNTGEPYAYAGNNPMNYIDPLGLWGISLGPVNIGNDGCMLGTNPDGSCRGSRQTNATGRAVGSAANWVKENPGTVATAVGIGVCIGATFGKCAFAAAGAFAVRSGERIHEQGFSDSLGANVADGAFTCATLGMVSAPLSQYLAGSQGAGYTSAQGVFARLGLAAPEFAGFSGGEIARWCAA